MGTPMDRGTAVCLGWLLVVLFIGAGLVAVFAKDLAWELTEWRNSAAGVQSERTRTWEVMTTIIGIAQIIFGVVLAFVFFGGR